MHEMSLLHVLAIVLITFGLGYGQRICKWSKRILPLGVTGNLSVVVPIYKRYRSGHVNEVPFGTYWWARGWCQYNQEYFRCTYETRTDVERTLLTFPNIENISYVMLKDKYPITLHKPEEQTVPGFYVKANDSLDICPDYTITLLRWYFNGNETDLKDLSCYADGEFFCSGVQSGGRTKDGICRLMNVDGRLHTGHWVSKPPTDFGYYHCYLDKEHTKALTYIVDWKNATKKLDPASMRAYDPPKKIPAVPATTSSGVKRLMHGLPFVWLGLVLAKQL